MSVSGDHLEMNGLDENSSAFRGRVPMVVPKAPCTVTGGGEDARQELAPKLRYR